MTRCRLLLRTGQLLLTRWMGQTSHQAFVNDMHDAKACMFAAMALAQHICGDDYHAYFFTHKAHIAATHLADTAMRRCHPCYSSDLWVERMLRAEACRLCRCALHNVTHRRVHTRALHHNIHLQSGDNICWFWSGEVHKHAV